MKKYLVETRPYNALRPGDLVGVSFGFLRFRSFEALSGGYCRLNLTRADGEAYEEIHYGGIWPEVAVGFTPEYQAAHPDEVFLGAAAAALLAEDGYPADHDPLLPELMHALTVAVERRDLNAVIVLRDLLEHYEAGTTDELALLIEVHRRPLVTGRPGAR